jgi:uncharacterized membrane protein YagU involved in acid resistance
MTLRMVRAGVAGGIVGGIILLLFLLGAGLATTKASPMVILLALLQFSAEWAIGKEALASTSYAWIGVLVHFGTSILWGLAFVYVAKQRPQVVQQPFIAGIVYGVIVWIGTQLVLMATGLFRTPSPNEIETELFAYCIFFGIPLAYTVAKLT